MLELSWLVPLGIELHRTIRTECLCLTLLAENVDLVVWISKCGIAPLANSTIPLTERPRASRGQRERGHGQEDNRREPKLCRSKHGFSRSRAPRYANVHAFAFGGKAVLPDQSTLLKSVAHPPHNRMAAGR
jgi:hypothetical protein